MRIPTRGTPDEWFEWLVGPDDTRRHEATLLFGGLTPDDPVPAEPLIARLSAGDSRVAFWAIVGLSRMGSRAAAALPELVQVAASDPAFGTRQGALRALARIAPQQALAKQAMLYALRDESPWVRAEALQALGQVPRLEESDLTAIRALEHDSEGVVRNQVERTLQEIRLRGSPAA